MKYASVLVPLCNISTVVNVTEGESLTVNCSCGKNDPKWSRKDGGDVDTKTRKRDGVLLRIENASIADTGVYVCKHGNDEHTIWIQVLGRSMSKSSMQMQKHFQQHTFESFSPNTTGASS